MINEILWDWNGTLLNDIDVCINSINQVLRKYSIKEIQNQNEYRKKFCFPIEQYYKNLGFDLKNNSFSNLAKEYLDIYQPISKIASLNIETINVLEYFKFNGFTQNILSASQLNNLIDQIYYFKIESYFQDIKGINNIFASSKIEIASQWLKENKKDPSNLLLIGDTYHDYEVSKFINCKCFLYLNGHQYLKNNIDAIFFNNLSEIPTLINNIR